MSKEKEKVPSRNQTSIGKTFRQIFYFRTNPTSCPFYLQEWTALRTWAASLFSSLLLLTPTPLLVESDSTGICRNRNLCQKRRHLKNALPNSIFCTYGSWKLEISKGRKAPHRRQVSKNPKDPQEGVSVSWGCKLKLISFSFCQSHCDFSRLVWIQLASCCCCCCCCPGCFVFVLGSETFPFCAGEIICPGRWLTSLLRLARQTNEQWGMSRIGEFMGP